MSEPLKTRCPVCGSPVTIEGTTTMYYKPENESLKEERDQYKAMAEKVTEVGNKIDYLNKEISFHLENVKSLNGHLDKLLDDLKAKEIEQMLYGKAGEGE